MPSAYFAAQKARVCLDLAQLPELLHTAQADRGRHQPKGCSKLAVLDTHTTDRQENTPPAVRCKLTAYLPALLDIAQQGMGRHHTGI